MTIRRVSVSDLLQAIQLAAPPPFGLGDLLHQIFFRGGNKGLATRFGGALLEWITFIGHTGSTHEKPLDSN